jgi:hypothetical protein
VRAVEPLGLIGRGQAEEHDNRVRPSREGDRLVGQRLVLVLGVDPEAGAKGSCTPSGTATRSSSSATSTRIGLTWELPEPWYRGARTHRSPVTKRERAGREDR